MTDAYQVRKLIDQLANERAHLDAIALVKQTEIDKILTPEIKSAIEDIELEYSEITKNTIELVGDLEKKIKELTIELGETIKGEFLSAVYIRGRVTWDSKGLAGYAVAHPEIETFKKTGNPSVTLRANR